MDLPHYGDAKMIQRSLGMIVIFGRKHLTWFLFGSDENSNSNNFNVFRRSGTMWMGAPNLISIIFLSLWTHSSWTMMGHHACHGGYNRTDASGRYSSRGFALGSVWRRLQDWFDWMLPDAWSVEHNQLHHYRLSEAHGNVGKTWGKRWGNAVGKLVSSESNHVNDWMGLAWFGEVGRSWLFKFCSYLAC